MNRVIIVSCSPEECSDILNGVKSILVRKQMPHCYFPIDVYIYCTKGKSYLSRINDDSFELTKIEKPYCEEHYVKDYNTQNGKVVAKFTLKDVSEFSCEFHEEPLFEDDSCYQGIKLVVKDEDYPNDDFFTEYFDVKTTNEDGYTDEEVVSKSKFLQKANLTLSELKNYAGIGFDKKVYAWNIEDLVVFDRPMELRQFTKVCFWAEYAPIFKCADCKYRYHDYEYANFCCQVCDGVIELKKAPKTWCYAEV